MAEEKIPSPEPEIAAPPSTAPQRPARPDPGVIDGEAIEIRDEAAVGAEAPTADGPGPAAQAQETPPPPEEPARAAFVPSAAAGLGGAILGAALALIAAWLIDPRAAALDDLRARLASLETSVDAQAGVAAALDKRVATLEASSGGAAKASALDALGRRVGGLEAAVGDAKTALDEARAARADAAKALAAAEAAPAPPSSAAPAEAGGLEPRLAKLEGDLAAAAARLDKLAGLDERLAKLEGASAAPKSDARVAPSKGAAEAAASAAVLALSLDQRFAAGAPYAPELGALSQAGVAADALAPLKPFAESGAPTPEALAAAWAKVGAAVAAAAAPADRNGWDRLLDHMRALVRVRRVGEAAGGDESAPPAERIGAALARGDVAAALEAFDRLPEPSRVAGRSWAETARARTAAAKAAAALRADAIGRLATARD